jgi:acyl-CoA synthetase (AMP-forming)/AMP-acid ligase II
MPPAWIEGSRETGFPALAAEVAAFAAWLEHHGVANRGVVGLSIVGERANLLASLALLALGVPQFTLATSDPLPMRAELAQRLGIGVVLADADGQELDGVRLLSIPSPLPSGALNAGTIAPVVADADAPALYLASSGTTGRAKLFALSQRNIAARGASLAGVEGYGPGDRLVIPMSAQTFHGRMTRLYALLAGATSVVHGSVMGPAAILELCARTSATNVHLGVLQVFGLAVEGAGGARLGPAVRVFSSSTRLPANVRADFESRIGGRLYDRYGTTEVGLLTITYPRGDEGVPDGVGRIVPGAEVEIVDGEGRALPRGTVGEIRARTPWMTHDYVDDPAAVARHFRDGWFHPGDLGAITPEGVLRFLGRADDMMSYGGINIFPAEIERVLDAHPAVRESAAFPVDAGALGQLPMAAVTLNGAAVVAPADLVAWARERLGARAPRRIAVLDALPRNAAGKVAKRDLAGLSAFAPT